MKDYRTYYVTHVYYNNGSYHHNSREYQTDDPLYDGNAQYRILGNLVHQ